MSFFVQCILIDKVQSFKRHLGVNVDRNRPFVNGREKLFGGASDKAAQSISPYREKERKKASSFIIAKGSIGFSRTVHFCSSIAALIERNRIIEKRKKIKRKKWAKFLHDRMMHKLPHLVVATENAKKVSAK